ncbi:MAG: DUF932 domain-containing protein [Pirellulales bacterium]
MVQATLVNHRGAVLIQREELAKIPTPPSTETWHPLPHIEVLDRVEMTLDGAGFRVETSQLSVARDSQRFFGVLKLVTKVTNECALAVGIRNSHDQSFPIAMVAGENCFVCDNLSFTSEVYVSRRHTKYSAVRFNEAISLAITEALPQYQLAAAQRIASLQAYELSPTEADSLLLRAFEAGIVSSRLLDPVLKEWRNPRHPEFRPRTAWSMLNAFTECFKERQKSNPQEAALQTIRLNRLIAPPERTMFDGNENPQPAIAG